MIRSIVVENELKGRATLINFLKQHCPDVEVVGEAGTIEESVEQIINNKPELVFLDINLPNGTGFDILEKVKAVDFELIFVTAYEEYALNAIKETHCCDYLIKPIGIKELIVAVEKARNNLAKANEMSILKKLDNQTHKLTIPTLERFEIIEIKMILYCQADRAWTTVFLTDGTKIVSSKNLNTFEKLLTEYGFYRSHRSFLLNLDHIRAYVRGRGGIAIMINGAKVEVSENKKSGFLGKLNILR